MKRTRTSSSFAVRVKSRTLLLFVGGVFAAASSLRLNVHVNDDERSSNQHQQARNDRTTITSPITNKVHSKRDLPRIDEAPSRTGPGPVPSVAAAAANTNAAGVDDVHPALDRIKVPFPIFVASLPKSGTTSTARYFYCGEIWTAHTFVNTNVDTSNSTAVIDRSDWPKQMRVGRCYQENQKLGRPPFESCGRYKVFSDMGHPKGRPCFYPSVHGLDAFYNAYPNATILLVTRNATTWASSVNRWREGILLKRWRGCDKFPRNGTDTTVAELEQFYNWHAENIRQFVINHPSLTYVEVSLDDEDIGEQLEDTIGVDSQCFGHHNSHVKRLQKNPKFRKQYLQSLNNTAE